MRAPRRLTAALAVVVTVALVAAAAVFATSGSGHRRRGAPAHPRVVATAATRLDVADAGWQLPAPVSRATVVADANTIVIAGGLDRSSASADGVFRLDPTNGSLTHAGTLAQATHDAAGAIVAGHLVVFGGGAQHVTDAVQSLEAGGTAHVVAHLPQPRADLAAVTVGTTTYLVGGYDGAHPTPAILATDDGLHFRTVATLPEPVRYPAVTVSDGAIWVFGGEVGGTATSAVQRVDVANGTARVVAHLPQPVAEASAVTLDGTMYVVGGRTNGTATAAALRFDPQHGATVAATLPAPVADAGAAVVGGAAYLVGGESGAPVASVVVLRQVTSTPGHATAAPPRPFDGNMLIADRGNNRLIVVDAAKHVSWIYPSPTAPPPAGGFYFPDDGFFVDHGRSIISNEEENDTIVRIAYPSGQLVWSYGHPRRASALPGFLDQPDDAYVLPDGRVTVADAKNCRILFISPQGRPLSQIGTTRRCVHDPPRAVGYPNGDTPLANGDVLVSEINGSWVSEYTQDGRLVWTVHLPVAYPSDPQQLGPDLYLIADYARPGGIVEFTREGRIVWQYRPPSGPGMLDHPSLAERLPNGLIGVNDDYRHRVALIDPTTSTIVWQYGTTDVPGTGPGQLHTPDGFDLLLPDGTTPTHPQTG